MGGYKVIRDFYDIRAGRRYKAGEPFDSPADSGRLAELSTAANRRGVPVIEKSDPEPDPFSGDMNAPAVDEKPKKGKKAKNDPV